MEKYKKSIIIISSILGLILLISFSICVNSIEQNQKSTLAFQNNVENFAQEVEKEQYKKIIDDLKELGVYDEYSDDYPEDKSYISEEDLTALKEIEDQELKDKYDYIIEGYEFLEIYPEYKDEYPKDKSDLTIDVIETMIETAISFSDVITGISISGSESFNAGLTKDGDEDVFNIAIDDFSILKNFNNLKSLSISFYSSSYTHEDEITIPKNLYSLERLSLSKDLGLGSCLYACSSKEHPYPVSTATIKLKGVENLTNLKSLSLKGFKLADYSVLASLTTLESLGLESAGFTQEDLIWIEDLTNLKSLSIVYSGLTNIDSLQNLTNLTSLVLAYNYIEDISVLANMHNLSYLTLTGNEIVSLEPLRNLTNLSTVYLSGNKIADVSPLAGLYNLEFLNISCNSIMDISPLVPLMDNTKINLGANNITNLTGVNPDNTFNYGSNGRSAGGAPYSNQTTYLTLEVGVESCIDYPIGFDGEYMTNIVYDNDSEYDPHFSDYIEVVSQSSSAVCLKPIKKFEEDVSEYHEYVSYSFPIQEWGEDPWGDLTAIKYYISIV